MQKKENNQEKMDIEITSLIKSLQSTSKSEDRLKILNKIRSHREKLSSSRFLDVIFSIIRNDADSHVRRSAILSLCYSKEKEVLAPLINAMHNDRDPYARFDASRTIGTLGFSEAIPALIKTIQKEKIKRIRDESAYSIGLIEDESAIPFLAELVENDTEIYGTAALAISRINGKNGTITLTKLLSVKRTENLWSVIYGLELLGKKAQKAIPRLINLAKTHHDESIRTKAIDAMGYIGGKLAIDFLEEELNNEQEEKLRFWLALAHGRIFGKDSKGANELLKMFAYNLIDDDQMTEYILLCRRFIFDLRNEANNSAKVKDITTTQKKLRYGESEFTEFKEHLLWNKKTQQINKDMRLKMAILISSFMNSQGGTIYIGIDNNQKVVGLEKDLSLLAKEKQNKDGFQLYLTSIIKQYIGLKFKDYYHIFFDEIDGHTICGIDIKRAPEPIFITDGSKTSFYIRAEGSKELLNTQEAVEYCKLHWN